MTTIEPDSDGLSRPVGHAVRRRTLLVAGAWSVPVIALATASPAMAASTPTAVVLLNSEFGDVEAGDTLPLIFAVTGADDGTAASATIVSGQSVAGWESGPGVAVAEVEDGQVIFLASALESGTFEVNVAIGGFSQNFTIEVILG